MRLIDSDINVADYIETAEVDWPGAGKQRVMAVDDLRYLPTIDPVEAAGGCYCRECKYWQDNNGGYPHPECRWGHGETPDPDDFCSYGEKEATND